MEIKASCVSLPNTREWELPSPSGPYKIQVSYPLQWTSLQGHAVPVIYAVDGDAMFLTATEAAWRRATGPHFQGGGVIVAIGYPLEGRVFSPRRTHDLTAGSGEFLEFIDTIVRPFIRTQALAGCSVTRECLYGHSFGGLFALDVLYRRPALFDCYVASSPSVYWDNWRILALEEEFRTGEPPARRPSLMIMYGEYEQDPPQWADEDDDKYRLRRDGAQQRAMTDSAKAMYRRLRGCGKLSVTISEYPGEDHGTVIACTLSRSLTTFFEEWPLMASV